MIHYFYPSEVVLNIIVNNIKKSGPFLIKLVQWTLPKIENMYDINPNNKEYGWFFKFEELYENCDFHSLEYTKKVFQREFKEDLNDKYNSIEEIASGSIGQVYKIIDKKTKVQKNDLFEVDQVDGYAMILDKNKFDNSFFDEKIFMYLENDDLCLRIRKAKEKIYIYKNSLISHLGGKTVDKKSLVTLSKKGLS